MRDGFRAIEPSIGAAGPEVKPENTLGTVIFRPDPEVLEYLDILLLGYYGTAPDY